MGNQTLLLRKENFLTLLIIIIYAYFLTNVTHLFNDYSGS